MMHADTLAHYEVEAQNLSRVSENKIHDDAVARQFGFTGALVPGVAVTTACTPETLRSWFGDANGSSGERSNAVSPSPFTTPASYT